jgi:hypothetical protein
MERISRGPQVEDPDRQAGIILLKNLIRRAKYAIDIEKW